MTRTIASVEASRLYTVKAAERAYARVGRLADKHHDEGQIMLANLPFCVSNYPAPCKQNHFPFSRISIEGWLALLASSPCHSIQKTIICVLVISLCDIGYETRLSGDGTTE